MMCKCEVRNRGKEKRRGMSGCKCVLLLLITIMSTFFMGCGYSKEEKEQMQQYEKQATENAICYISEKYGFQANVLETDCETLEVIAVPDFSPSATGDVLVSMEYDGHEFLVLISGEEKTTDGIDNYQLDQIRQTIMEEVNSLTGLSAREILVIYGKEYNAEMESRNNGLVHTYYDGSNLPEVLSENNYQMICSCVDEDLSLIDAEVIKESLGDGEALFVSYRSEDDYKAVSRSINLGGIPLSYNIDDKALYIDEYRVIGGNEEKHVVYDLREQDGIYYIPEDADSQVVLTETVLDDASNWNGRGFVNAVQVLDTAYTISTDSRVIHFFIPVNLLESNADSDTIGTIVYQYKGDDGTKYNHAITSLSDDGKYLVGSIDMRNYSDIKVSVLSSR